MISHNDKHPNDSRILHTKENTTKFSYHSRPLPPCITILNLRSLDEMHKKSVCLVLWISSRWCRFSFLKYVFLKVLKIFTDKSNSLLISPDGAIGGIWPLFTIVCEWRENGFGFACRQKTRDDAVLPKGILV